MTCACTLTEAVLRHSTAVHSNSKQYHCIISEWKQRAKDERRQGRKEEGRRGRGGRRREEEGGGGRRREEGRT